MDDKNKLTFTIVGGIALLFFLATRFCIPISKENAKLSAEYRDLNAKVKILEDFSESQHGSLIKRINAAIISLDEKFPQEKELKLNEYLTRLPSNSKIVFEEILHRDQRKSEGYNILPVEVSMKASFYDFMNYLTAIYTGPVMIGVSTLTISRDDPTDQTLAIKIKFFGFSLTYKAPATSTYMELDRPIDTAFLETLLEPLTGVSQKEIVVSEKKYNPFFTTGISRKKVDLQQAEIIPSRTIPTIEDISLRGIIQIGDKKGALINERVVMKGDTIDGMRVIEIKDYEVVMMRSGNKFILKMGVEDGIIKH